MSNINLYTCKYCNKTYIFEKARDICESKCKPWWQCYHCDKKYDNREEWAKCEMACSDEIQALLDETLSAYYDSKEYIKFESKD